MRNEAGNITPLIAEIATALGRSLTFPELGVLSAPERARRIAEQAGSAPAPETEIDIESLRVRRVPILLGTPAERALCRHIDTARVKGIRDPVLVYELLWRPDGDATLMLEAWATQRRPAGKMMLAKSGATVIAR